MSESWTSVDVAVVGGGLAGLTAATYLARAGKKVRLFERSSSAGGRAATQTKNGFSFNIGPHALYRGSAGKRILDDLGIKYHGTMPKAAGFAVRQGRKHPLPAGLGSLLTTSLFSFGGKLEMMKIFAGLGKIDPAPLQHTTVDDWLRSYVRREEVRGLLRALVRVATYTNAPARQSAGAAIRQVQLAFGENVLYLDGGWQTLVDGLVAAAKGLGVEIVTSARVDGIDHDRQVRGVRLSDGALLPVAAVVVATPPDVAAELAPEVLALRRWATAATPIKAACLDLGLSRLPDPRAPFALGIDQPLYFSVHSAYAKLAPEGGATIHVAKYLDPDQHDDAKAVEAELEALADLVQPGWRQVVVERRYLPSMTVFNALVTAEAGGYAGRPGPAVADVDGLYVAGDWVGPDALLVDASFASARRAAEAIVQGGTARARAAA